MKKIKSQGQRVLKVGLVGCGTIGSGLAQAIQKRFKPHARVSYVCDSHENRAQILSRKLSSKPSIVSLPLLIQKSDFVIEAASAKVSASICAQALRYHKRVLIMSVGGLVHYPALSKDLKKSRGKLYVPSGAICGLDGLKAARMGKIKSVTLTTSKPPRAFLGAPFLQKKKIDVTCLKKPQIIFKGNAHQAIQNFPENINVSCVLSLAGLGAKKTKVQIVCDPKLKRNVHEVRIEGDFGILTTRSENVPSPSNPKTSQLAILSAVATLEKIFTNFRIGT